jgi:hypothetical protein
MCSSQEFKRTPNAAKPADLRHFHQMDVKWRGGSRHKCLFPFPKIEINPYVNEI